MKKMKKKKKTLAVYMHAAVSCVTTRDVHYDERTEPTGSKST